MLKGDRIVIIATTDISKGDEIFIDYGLDYWRHKIERLSAKQAAEVRERLARRGDQGGGRAASTAGA